MFAEYGYGDLLLIEVGTGSYFRPTAFQQNQQGDNGFDEINDVTRAWEMVRKGNWKLSYMFHGQEELYNVKEDPYELKNQIGDPSCRKVRDELRLENY